MIGLMIERTVSQTAVHLVDRSEGQMVAVMVLMKDLKTVNMLDDCLVGTMVQTKGRMLG